MINCGVFKLTKTPQLKKKQIKLYISRKKNIIRNFFLKKCNEKKEKYNQKKKENTVQIHSKISLDEQCYCTVKQCYGLAVCIIISF